MKLVKTTLVMLITASIGNETIKEDVKKNKTTIAVYARQAKDCFGSILNFIRNKMVLISLPSPLSKVS